MKGILWRPSPGSGERRRPKSNPPSRRHCVRQCRPGPPALRDPARLACLPKGGPARQGAGDLRRRGGRVAGTAGDPIERAWLRARTLGLRALPQACAGHGVPGATARGGHHSLATQAGDAPALPAPLIYSPTTRSFPVRLALRRFSSARLKKENALSSSGRYDVTPALTVSAWGATPCASSA